MGVVDQDPCLGDVPPTFYPFLLFILLLCNRCSSQHFRRTYIFLPFSNSLGLGVEIIVPRTVSRDPTDAAGRIPGSLAPRGLDNLSAYIIRIPTTLPTTPSPAFPRTASTSIPRQPPRYAYVREPWCSWQSKGSLFRRKMSSHGSLTRYHMIKISP